MKRLILPVLKSTLKVRSIVQSAFLVLSVSAFAEGGTASNSIPAWKRFLASIDLTTAMVISVIIGIVLTLFIKSKISSPAAIWAVRIIAFIVIFFDIAIWFSQ